MSTAVDSSILFAVFNKEPGWEVWSAVLRDSLSEGPLIVCPIVFAEVSVGSPSADVCLQALRSLSIEFSAFTPQSARLAAIDRGYMRRYFTELELVVPSDPHAEQEQQSEQIEDE